MTTVATSADRARAETGSDGKTEPAAEQQIPLQQKNALREVMRADYKNPSEQAGVIIDILKSAAAGEKLMLLETFLTEFGMQETEKGEPEITGTPLDNGVAEKLQGQMSRVFTSTWSAIETTNPDSTAAAKLIMEQFLNRKKRDEQTMLLTFLITCGYLPYTRMPEDVTAAIASVPATLSTVDKGEMSAYQRKVSPLVSRILHRTDLTAEQQQVSLARLIAREQGGSLESVATFMEVVVHLARGIAQQQRASLMILSGPIPAALRELLAGSFDPDS